MKTLLLDNYDSFTFNLFHLLAAVRGEEPLVLSNDQADLEEIRGLPIDSAVISPGPGRPERPGDIGICLQVLRHLDLPQLGVCLGHQGLAHAFGGQVLPSPLPIHGETSPIHHRHPPLFAGIPQGFAAVRYHSLIVAPQLPPGLESIAWTADGLLMGLKHRQRPLWGVQFHPESICTEYGEQLTRNFLAQVPAKTRWTVPDLPDPPRPCQVPSALPPFHWRQALSCPDPETTFGRLFSTSALSFWLDSAQTGPGARFSYMGEGQHLLRYRAADRELCIGNAPRRQRLFEYLRSQAPFAGGNAAPFPFCGGWVGYLGYEFKTECLGLASPPSPHPDAALLEVDRYLVFDHQVPALYLAFAGPEDEARAWFAQTEARLACLEPLPAPHPTAPHSPFPFRLRQGREVYLQQIRRCLEAIGAGESYELCLTDQFQAPPLADPWTAYRVLRRRNPAPYAAYLRLGELQLLSSSPEQFLRVDALGRVVTRPIKGTRGRGASPAADEALRRELTASAKDRAENLMITDLLRHDLGRVCRVGSVQVPSLMAVETFASCHQLVSTVCGQLRPDCDALDCLEAAFPGGSMTGAPKRRSVELLDQFEVGPRGPYAGALGFLGRDGQLELSILIRAAITSPTGTAVGAGGAIVARSDPEAEFAELLLKAGPVIEALTIAQTGRGVVSPPGIV